MINIICMSDNNPALSYKCIVNFHLSSSETLSLIGDFESAKPIEFGHKYNCDRTTVKHAGKPPNSAISQTQFSRFFVPHKRASETSRFQTDGQNKDARKRRQQ